MNVFCKAATVVARTATTFRRISAADRTATVIIRGTMSSLPFAELGVRASRDKSSPLGESRIRRMGRSEECNGKNGVRCDV